MIKDIPAEGDVYYSDEAEMSLTITFEKYDLYWGLWETGQSFCCWNKDAFRNYKYLGKSKANINQLFEVQDDNR